LKKILFLFLFFFIQIQESFAFTNIDTSLFISELKIKIKNYYNVNFEDIKIDWQDESLEKKFLEIQKNYPNKNINFNVKDVIIKNIVGKFSIPVEVYVENKLNRIIYLKCKVDILKEVVVAKTNIKKGDIIDSSNIFLKKLEMSKLPLNVISNDIANLYGKVAANNIEEGKPLTPDNVKNRIVIFRGDEVTIRIKNGSLTLTAIGQSLQDGYIGQNITVRVLSGASKKNIVAKVLDVNLVELNLGENSL
jgi:flagella basal body P-ring formation protein FlgA